MSEAKNDHKTGDEKPVAAATLGSPQYYRANVEAPRNKDDYRNLSVRLFMEQDAANEYLKSKAAEFKNEEFEIAGKVWIEPVYAESVKDQATAK
jgi:hypothetical protein